MGMYLTIAEYHRLNENRETLLCRKDFHKINIYEDALGEEVYKKLFNIALIFQKDFLAALYLIAISKRYPITLKSDKFFEEILNNLKSSVK